MSNEVSENLYGILQQLDLTQIISRQRLDLDLLLKLFEEHEKVFPGLPEEVDKWLSLLQEAKLLSGSLGQIIGLLSQYIEVVDRRLVFTE